MGVWWPLGAHGEADELHGITELSVAGKAVLMPMFEGRRTLPNEALLRSWSQHVKVDACFGMKGCNGAKFKMATSRSVSQ